MDVIDYRSTPELYAQLYSRLDITGTQFLAFRDLPQLIDQYLFVNNNATRKCALDYGCGAGKSSMLLKSIGLEVESVDINGEMIKAAKANDPGGIYNVIKSGVIPSDQNVYDLVVASWVLMEISTKHELLKVLNEIYRVLKYGGIFITIVCNNNTYNNDWVSINTEFDENQNLISGGLVKIVFKDINLAIYDYFWSDEDYKEVIDNGKFELLNIYNPLGTKQDGYNWINEDKISPYSIYITRKQ